MAGDRHARAQRMANVRGCDAASFTVTHRRKPLESPASTDDLAHAVDRLQYELGEGPCVDAAWEERIVHSGDLTADACWPAWGPRAVGDQGVHSVLCLQLFTHSDVLGALNLYSRAPQAFDREALEDGAALAAHVAVAVAASQDRADLRAAIDTRTVIGQATGILMERYGLDASKAFALLTRVSSQSNVRVRDLAQELVDTGQIAAIE